MREENFDIKAKASTLTEVANEKAQETQKYTALCTNCNERLDCKIRCNTSVIWHCEEYS